MANKALKERHWERLAGVTGHTFEVESENFLLRNIMEAPLLESKEDIEVRELCLYKLVYINIFGVLSVFALSPIVISHCSFCMSFSQESIFFLQISGCRWWSRLL